MEIFTDDATITLRGDFDVRSTMEVRAAIYEQLRGREVDLVVDLTDVRTVDLTALRLLAVATRQAARDGHHLTLRGCGPAVRRMLTLSRIGRVVDVERETISA